MYYRRKIILALLEVFDGELLNTRFQKLLFLLTRNQEEKSFDFIPYKFGCYSLQANQDLHTLIVYKEVEKVEKNGQKTWKKISNKSFFSKLKLEDKKSIVNLKEQFGSSSINDLIKFTYVNYPYFAIYSNIVEEILNKSEIDKVAKQKRIKINTTLYTIGYEGCSIESFLNKLILNDVQLLIDVRKNPLSRKFGFSKKQLKNACESINISYTHTPELGIISSLRQNLESKSDYIELFKQYRSTLKNIDLEKTIIRYFNSFDRVAITCFEKEHTSCHRGVIADKVKKSNKWQIQVQHL